MSSQEQPSRPHQQVSFVDPSDVEEDNQSESSEESTPSLRDDEQELVFPPSPTASLPMTITDSDRNHITLEQLFGPTEISTLRKRPNRQEWHFKVHPSKNAPLIEALQSYSIQSTKPAEEMAGTEPSVFDAEFTGTLSQALSKFTSLESSEQSELLEGYPEHLMKQATMLLDDSRVKLLMGVGKKVHKGTLRDLATRCLETADAFSVALLASAALHHWRVDKKDRWLEKDGYIVGVPKDEWFHKILGPATTVLKTTAIISSNLGISLEEETNLSFKRFNREKHAAMIGEKPKAFEIDMMLSTFPRTWYEDQITKDPTRVPQPDSKGQSIFPIPHSTAIVPCLQRNWGDAQRTKVLVQVRQILTTELEISKRDYGHLNNR